MYVQEKLPYAFDALTPHIDAKTMEIHYSKHHAAYVNNLNAALVKYPEIAEKPIEEVLGDVGSVPENVRQQVINHGGGHVNHTFFWNIMIPGKSQPHGEALEAIEKRFKDLDSFKDEFTQKAMGVFGSGWAFLVVNKKKELELTRHSFQNSPLMQGKTPVLGIDVWEHAYYLKYQNRRAEYIEAWWNIVNWEQVEENYKSSSV
jgi:superoxide dismutase, Fe-Mn family